MQRKLTDVEFKYLKELYVDRIVEGMMTKDLVRYVMNSEQEWIDSLTYNEAMDELLREEDIKNINKNKKKKKKRRKKIKQ